MPKVVAISVGRPREVEWQGRIVRTSIVAPGDPIERLARVDVRLTVAEVVAGYAKRLPA